MRSRRRYGRSRYQPRNKTKLTFTPVIVILCLSVGCGYAAAKYVVDPVVNYVPELMAEKAAETDSSKDGDSDIAGLSDGKDKVVEDEVDSAEEGKVAGYALQFGCYTSKTAAEATMATIGVDGLQILEQNNMYKIIGDIYKTKAEAKTALDEVPETINAFVTTIYE